MVQLIGAFIACIPIKSLIVILSWGNILGFKYEHQGLN